MESKCDDTVPLGTLIETIFQNQFNNFWAKVLFTKYYVEILLNLCVHL